VSYDFNLAGYERMTLSGTVQENQSITLNASLLSFDRIASSREVRNQPKPLSQVPPRLDPSVPVGSTVTITFVVDRDGSTRDHTFELKEKSDNAVFAQRCIDAIKQWKFSPALNQDGKPVNVKISVPFNVTPQAADEPGKMPWRQ
jgi:TonB family protein